MKKGNGPKCKWYLSLHKKWSFPLRKTSFFVQCLLKLDLRYPCTFLYKCDALRNLLVQFKKRKSTHGEMIHLVKLQAEACDFTKSITHQSITFLRFLSCTNGTKSRKATHIYSTHILYTFTYTNILNAYSYISL